MELTSFFKDITALELQHNYVEALELLIKAKNQPEYKGLVFMIDMNIKRILLRVDRLSKECLDTGKAIFEHAKNPLTYIKDVKGLAVKDWPVLISLTTISSRINRVVRTIETLKNQNYPIHSINLYISSEPYLLDEGISADSPVLKELHDLGVNIYDVKNIGPYRKQYPIIMQLKSIDADRLTPIITVDDDVLYPPTIVGDLVNGCTEMRSVVSHRGRQMMLNSENFEEYSKFVVPNQHSDILNLGTGKNGILYRLGFFSNHYAEYYGPIIAPTADDLWCKWVTALKGIPTVILQPRAAYDPSLDFAESAPDDKVGLFHKFNAKGKNDVAINRLEMYCELLGTTLYSVCAWKNH